MEALKAHHKERESYVRFLYDRRLGSFSQARIHNHTTTFTSQLMRPGMLSFSANQLILEVLVYDENCPNIFVSDPRY
jgi:hypothetical protein